MGNEYRVPMRFPMLLKSLTGVPLELLLVSAAHHRPGELWPEPGALRDGDATCGSSNP